MKKILYLVTKFILGILLVFAGYMHFVKTGFYLKAMPSFIPFHEFMVYASGVLEILFGILLLIPKFTQKAAWLIVALFIAVFPANVNMYLNHENFSMSEQGLLIRLPIQLLLILWAWVYTKKRY